MSAALAPCQHQINATFAETAPPSPSRRDREIASLCKRYLENGEESKALANVDRIRCLSTQASVLLTCFKQIHGNATNESKPLLDLTQEC